MSVSGDEILEKFSLLFRGDLSAYVKHQAPFTEEKGKTTASWCGFAVYNKRNPPPAGAEAGDFIPVTRKQYKEHLNGEDGLALSPLTHAENRKNVCYYAVIDIDVYGVNFTRLVASLYRSGFKFAAFLSKSGGLHIYFFFAEPEPAKKAIEALKKIVEVYGMERIFVNKDNKSKVEIFPKQAVLMAETSRSNCLFLPFYNAANKSRQNMLTAEGKQLGIVKAIPVIESVVTSVKEIDSVLEDLPYGDAPYCIQAILLTGALAENDGRNDFLFSCAIYLKKKYKDDFKDALEEMNNCLAVPLEQREVDSVYTSVTTRGFDNYACSKLPCSGYCNKGLCALREHGKGRKKGNLFTGADCWGEISRVQAREPYFLWQVCVNPDEGFKTVRADSVDDLYSQATMQKCCLRDLNWAPFQIKHNDWIATVNKAMVGIDDRLIEVPKHTDTTELGMLHGLFVRYLTHGQVQHGKPYMVKVGHVYHADGAYYFLTEGFMDFLRFGKFNLGRTNLREKLIEYGCSDGVLTYKTAKGEDKAIPCWKKPDDPELLGMDDFYEEVYEGDEEAIRDIRLDKEDGGGGGSGEETKF
jgi:hypothetical protein